MYGDKKRKLHGCRDKEICMMIKHMYSVSRKGLNIDFTGMFWVSKPSSASLSTCWFGKAESSISSDNSVGIFVQHTTFRSFGEAKMCECTEFYRMLCRIIFVVM